MMGLRMLALVVVLLGLGSMSFDIDVAAESVVSVGVQSQVWSANDSAGRPVPTGYALSGTGCETGERHFDSKEAFCSSLLVDAATPACEMTAKALRRSWSCGNSHASTSPVAGVDLPPGATSGVVVRQGGVKAVVSSIDASHRYSVTTPTCTTGEQKFDTKNEFCAALLSRSRNDSCALEKRTEIWLEHCEGKWRETP